MLESRNVNAALEGPRHRSLSRGLTPGSDKALKVGSCLPGSEACLEPISQSFDAVGGSACEEPIGMARDLVDGGRDVVGYEVEDDVGNVR